MKKQGFVLALLFSLGFAFASSGVVKADQETDGSDAGQQVTQTTIATETDSTYDAPADDLNDRDIEPNATGQIEYPYYTVFWEDEFGGGALSPTAPLTNDNISYGRYNGINVDSTQANLNAGRITINDRFNFDNNPVGRIEINAVVSGNYTGYMNVYVDDETDPIASIKMKSSYDQDVDDIDGTVTQDVYAARLSGEHKISIGFSISGGAEADEVSVLLRTIEFAQNSLPVVYFHIDESGDNPTIDEMNESEDHSVNCYGSVDIQVPDGYVSEYTGLPESDYKNMKLEYIRGRGNSTWGCPKKPYKFKLDKGKDLFGMGKNKHWVLLANYYDNSLSRNRMTYWLAAELGIPYTPQCIPVEVVMNDQYYGTYLLCEQIRIGTGRVEIDELKDDDTDDPIITGGYLLSMSPYGSEPEVARTQTANEVFFGFDTPNFYEEGNEVQRDYINNYLQKTENAILGEDYKDESGVSYKEYMDIDSAVDYWWIQELSRNGDAYYTPSTYLYKKREGKLFWGPLWDFDLVAWGDLNYDEDYINGFNNCTMLWFDYLKSDKEFIDAVKKRWPDIDQKLEEITREGGLLDRYYEEQKIAEDYNTRKWGRYESDLLEYSEEIDDLRNWVSDRRDWINENFDELDSLTAKIEYYIDDEIYYSRIYSKGIINYLPDAPEKEGLEFSGWFDEDGNRYNLYEQAIMDDIKLYGKYVDPEKAKKPDRLFFANYDVVANIEDYYYYPIYSLYPEDYEYSKIQWSSSDTDIADVDSEGTGQVYMYNPGTVTITATLLNGESFSFNLTIVEGGMEDYDLYDISYDHAIEMYVGDILQAIPNKTPKASRASLYYEMKDESIAKVDFAGVITALKAGETTMTVTDDYTGVSTKVKIIVKEKKDDPEEGKYVFTVGAGGTWKKGSAEGFVSEVEREGDKAGTFDHYKGAKVDGKELSANDGIAEQGSVKLTIKPEYLEKLAVGEHTLELVFDDGTVSTTFTVVDKDPDKEPEKKDDKPAGNSGNSASAKGSSPKTGDAMPLAVIIVGLILSMGYVVGYYSKKYSR